MFMVSSYLWLSDCCCLQRVLVVYAVHHSCNSVSDLGIWFCFSCLFFFFFKQKTAYEMRISDWSSDVCSSDLGSTGSPRPRARSIRAPRPDPGRPPDRPGPDRRARPTRPLREWISEAPPPSLSGSVRDFDVRSGARDAKLSNRMWSSLRNPHTIDRKSTRLNSSH